MSERNRKFWYLQPLCISTSFPSCPWAKFHNSAHSIFTPSFTSHLESALFDLCWLKCFCSGVRLCISSPFQRARARNRLAQTESQSDKPGPNPSCVSWRRPWCSLGFFPFRVQSQSVLLSWAITDQVTRHREQTELSQPRYRKSKMKVLAKILKGLASFCLVGSHCYNLICRCARGRGGR